jgi:hypothetical protein
MVDIVNSKKLSKENREEVQFFIKQSLDVLNKIFRPSLTFDIIFSAGDEVQGLFKNPSSAVMYYRLLKMILAPLQIRCGIGVGEWDVKIINGTSSEQDGSAYHNAREAISQAHNTVGWNVLLNSNSDNDFYINTLLNSSFLLSRKQSVYQNEVSLLVELTNPFFDANVMELDGLQEILNLLQDKGHINYYLSTKGKNDVFKNVYNASIGNDPIQIFSENIYEEKMFLESTIKKGISTKISNITNTTRQNIDNIIKSANILSIRNIDLTTIIFIYRNYQR